MNIQDILKLPFTGVFYFCKGLLLIVIWTQTVILWTLFLGIPIGFTIYLISELGIMHVAPWLLVPALIAYGGWLHQNS